MCLKWFSMQHQNMVWQDIIRWSKQNQNMGLWKHQKNMRLEALKLRRWYHATEALQGQKIRRCCTKLFDSDDNQTLYLQTSDQKKVQVAGYADKRNVKAIKGNVSRHSVNKARGS